MTDRPVKPVLGILGIIECDGRLLLIQRSANVKVPLTWCFPGGHIEEGETQPEALVRELREELNIDVVPGSFLVTQTKRDGRLVLHCWSARIVDGQQPVKNPREVAQFAWLTADEVRGQKDLLDGTTAILDEIGL